MINQPLTPQNRRLHVHSSFKCPSFARMELLRKAMKSICTVSIWKKTHGEVSKWVFPKIIVPPNHPFVHRDFSIIFTLHFGGPKSPYFWFNTRSQWAWFIFRGMGSRASILDFHFFPWKSWQFKVPPPPKLPPQGIRFFFAGLFFEENDG